MHDMDDRVLMQLHVRALFTHDRGDRLLRVNDRNGALAPRFFLGRTARGHEWRFRNDLPGDLVQELETLCQREPLRIDTDEEQVETSAYISVLNRHPPVQAVWTGPSYYCSLHADRSAGTILVTAPQADVLGEHF